MPDRLAADEQERRFTAKRGTLLNAWCVEDGRTTVAFFDDRVIHDAEQRANDLAYELEARRGE